MILINDLNKALLFLKLKDFFIGCEWHIVIVIIFVAIECAVDVINVFVWIVASIIFQMLFMENKSMTFIYTWHSVILKVYHGVHTRYKYFLLKTDVFCIILCVFKLLSELN